MKRSLNFWLPVMLIILGLLVFSLVSQNSSRQVEYSSFLTFVEEGSVESVVIERSSGSISGQLSSPTQILDDRGEEVAIQSFTTTTTVTDTLISELADNSTIDVSIRNPPPWQAFAFSIMPLVILLGYFAGLAGLILFIFYFFSRKDKREAGTRRL